MQQIHYHTDTNTDQKNKNYYYSHELGPDFMHASEKYDSADREKEKYNSASSRQKAVMR